MNISKPKFHNITLKKVAYTLAPLIIILLFCLSDIIFFIQNGEITLTYMVPVRMLLLFLIPLPFVRNHIRAYAVIPASLAVVSVLACFPVIYFKTRVDEGVINLIWHTNYQEAKELLQGYIIYILILLILEILLLIYLIKKLPRKISIKKSGILSLTSLALLTIVPLISSGGKNYLYKVSHNIGEYYPFYIVNNGIKFFKYQELIKNHASLVKNFRFKVTNKDTLKQRQIYILLIGESSRYDHWGINGYSRNTSPKLDKQPNLISFNNVFAPGAITEMSVPLIITQATPQNYSMHVREKSIVSLFKAAGFDTYWITNQGDNGDIRIHEEEADTVIGLQAPYNATKNIHRDMELVDTLKQVMSRNPHNLFIVLHTMGSHWDYRARYPSQYDVYNPTGKGEFLQYWLENKAKFINAYDNTILYTDAVVDSVIHLCTAYSKVSFMVYLSDHGENLFDDSRNFIFHATSNASKYTAHIPLFIYTSPEYNRLYDKKIRALKSHVNSKISGADIFATLADMANIRFQHQDLSRSIANKAYIGRPRFMSITPEKYVKCSDLK